MSVVCHYSTCYSRVSHPRLLTVVLRSGLLENGNWNENGNDVAVVVEYAHD